jgi:hypothetical protein
MDPYLAHGIVAAAASALILAVFCWFAARKLQKELSRYTVAPRRCEKAVAESHEARKTLQDSIRVAERAVLPGEKTRECRALGH